METVPRSEGNHERPLSPIRSGDLSDDAKARKKDLPRAVILSDVRLYREGLALALSGRADVEVVGSVETSREAIPLIAASSETVLVLDAGMPDALEVTRELIKAAPSTKIVAVAVSDETTDVIGCAEAGMAGYVARDGSIDEVVAAIHSAVRGETRCSPQIVAKLFKRLASLSPGASVRPDRKPLLTARELEIVELIDEGLSNKEIARHLRIGTATVKNHVHHILEKLHVTRRGQAAASMRAGQSAPPVPAGRPSNHSRMNRAI
jgi:two-component system nitrate/nitrite response regulator NarL